MAEVRDPWTGHQLTDEELTWIGGHMTELRRAVSERRIRSQLLLTGLVVGLVAHVVGFLVKSSGPAEPAAVVADLLYTFGWALWTGVVVVALVEILPAAKERQITRILDDYEGSLRVAARTTGARPSHGARPRR